MIFKILLALALLALFGWLYRFSMKELEEGRTGPQPGMKWKADPEDSSKTDSASVPVTEPDPSCCAKAEQPTEQNLHSKNETNH